MTSLKLEPELLDYVRATVSPELPEGQDTHTELMERFRFWYESRRLSRRSYARYIAPIPAPIMLETLQTTMHMWSESGDLRCLNFGLKIRDDMAQAAGDLDEHDRALLHRLADDIDQSLHALKAKHGLA